MTGHLNRDRIDAHAKLLTSIAGELDAGERVPCVGNPERWQSEDPAEQEAAAHGCQSCAALDACRRYVTAHPEPEGIWAGLKFRDQKRLHREVNR